MGDVSGFLTDPDEDFTFDGDEATIDNDELTNADLPEGWTEEIQRAFWVATSAPTRAESQEETLRFATLLERHTGGSGRQETAT